MRKKATFVTWRSDVLWIQKTGEVNVPKPKLSDEQRKALRKEIGEMLSKKAKPADIIKEIADKYKISPFTARYHLNRVKGARPGRKPGKKKVASKRKVGKKKATRRRAGPQRKAIRTWMSKMSGTTIESAKVSIKDIEMRTSQARGLFKKLNKAFAESGKLRRKAEAWDAKAKEIEARIKKLTS